MKLLCLLMVASAALAQSQSLATVKRIHVGEFGDSDQARVTRDEMVSVLVNSKRFTAVEDADAAEAVLLGSSHERTRQIGIVRNPVSGEVMSGSGSTRTSRSVAARLVGKDKTIIWALDPKKCQDGSAACVIRELIKAAEKSK